MTENQLTGPDSSRYLYGLVVVLAGFAVVLVVFILSNNKWSESKDVTAAVGAVTGVVGTLAGAFFGVHVGAAGKDRAEAERDAAQNKVEKLAALMAPDQAARVLNIRQ
jgi:hypothetical protein